MTNRAKRIAAAVTVTTTVAAWGITAADGAPSAQSAAGNTLTATAVITDGPPNRSGEIIVTITGQIGAQGHKYGPRHCLAERAVFAQAMTLGGAIQGLGDSDHPTDKKGRFEMQQIHAKYGTPDAPEALIPYSGGPVTFTLTVSRSKAPKKRGDILSSYTCKPLTATTQVQAPPWSPE